MYKIQIEHINFAGDDKRGEDGAVWYLILSPCAECLINPEHHGCEIHPKMVHNYERQAFRLGSSGYRLDAAQKEIDENKANVWGWDGSKENLTLRPSFLAVEHRPYRLHSYITNGKLEILGDSTVVLEENPQHCWNI